MPQEPTVLLVHPPIFDFTAFDNFLYPLGLLELGARLEAAGVRTVCVDALDRRAVFDAPPRSLRLRPPTFRQNGTGHFHRRRIETPAACAFVPRRFHRFGIPRDALKEQMARAVGKGQRPLAVGVTCTMTYWSPGVREVAEIARELFGDVPVVLGGIYATLCPDHARRESGADVVVEGDDPLPLFEILGIGATTQDAPPRRPAHHVLGPRDTGALRASTGCPFHCTYCASRELSGPHTRRPVEDVAAELAFLVEERQCRHLAFHDDALVAGDGASFLELADAIAGQSPAEAAAFHSINGLNASAITDPVAKALHRTGFATIRLGLETIDDALRERTGFKSSAEDLKSALAALRSAGFSRRQIGVYVMAGLPGQSYASVLETIRFVHDSGALVRLTEFAPVPGTVAFDEAQGLSRLDLSEPLHQSKCLAAYRFDTLTAAQLREAKDFVSHLNVGLLDGEADGET